LSGAYICGETSVGAIFVAPAGHGSWIEYVPSLLGQS
jgi:hypothetical protein